MQTRLQKKMCVRYVGKIALEKCESSQAHFTAEAAKAQQLQKRVDLSNNDLESVAKKYSIKKPH